MIGVITLKQIDDIINEYGFQVAIRAMAHKGTWLSFLADNDFFAQVIGL